jgi:hypothetical protein
MVDLTYVEIYNEKFRDLLFEAGVEPEQGSAAFETRESAVDNVTATDASRYVSINRRLLCL